MGSIPFPDIDPVAISLGNFEIRWYGIAYVVGIVLGWIYCRALVRRYSSKMTLKQVDDFVVWATLGIVLGGRLGWALFYMPEGYFDHFWEVIYLWRPGMSFHGGILGVVIATFLFCLRYRLPIFEFGDNLVSVAPIGLFFGRIANFINSELYGRTTDVSWGMVFPTGGPLPRHPSQLYEAGLEGLFLFVLLFILERFTQLRRNYPGVMTGLFFIGYACSRSFVELFRQPDEHIGFLIFGTTMGQLLSIPLVLFGIYSIFYAIYKKRRLIGEQAS